MKTSSIFYFLGALIAITGAVLRISHILESSHFYSIIAISTALGLLGNYFRNRDLKQKQQQ